MKKKYNCRFFFFLIFILFNTNSFGQLRPGIVWQKCIGGTINDVASDVLITDDNNIVVVGSSYSNDVAFPDHHGTTTTSDAIIIKMDTAGNVIWKKSIGGTDNDVFTTVIAAVDGGYICAGTTFSSDGDITGQHGNADILAVKVNADGTIAWKKCYGGSLKDSGTDITQTGDGNYAFIGTSFSYTGDVLSGQVGRTDSDAWAFKTDPSGNIIWEKCIDFTFNFYIPRPHDDVGYNICRSETGNLYALTTGTIDFDSHYTPGYADTPRVARHELYELNNSNGNITLIGPSPDERNAHGTDTLYSMHRAADRIYIGFRGNYFEPHDHCYLPFASGALMKMDGTNTFNTSFPAALGSGPDITMCGEDVFPGMTYIAPVHGVSSEPTLDAFMAVGKTLGVSPNYIAGAFVTIGNKLYVYGNGGTFFNSVKVFPSGTEYIVVGHEFGDGGDVSGHHGGTNGTSDCWIVKLQGLNQIAGKIFIDANNNNILDAGELPFNGGMAKTTKQGFETDAIPYNGIYRNVVDTGTFTTVFNVNRPYHTVTPASKTSVFTTYRNTDSANFAVHPMPGIQDYMIGMISMSQPRPGSYLHYNIPYFNAGTTILTNKIITFIKDSRTQVLFTTPGYTSISGDTIKWNISTLAQWTGGNISVNLEVATPPTVNIGDILTSSVLIDSAGDYHVADNYFVMHETVIGSYDPNDKRESFAGEIYPADIAAGKWLNYNIRFQNTGTDTAFNIILRDTLDSKLNADSIEVIGASHAYSVNIKNKKYLTVQFNNIKLVDSTHNEPLSHGYFSYRIKPVATLALGDTIRNNASIYFDFNLPVKTNTEITIYTITDQWTGAVSTAWEDPLNWRSHLVPDINTNVIINTGAPRYPLINSDAVCRSITIKTGASVLVKTGFTLHVIK